MSGDAHPDRNLFASASSIGGACKFLPVGRRRSGSRAALLIVPLHDVTITRLPGFSRMHRLTEPRTTGAYISFAGAAHRPE